MLTDIPLLYGSPRLFFGDTLTSLSQPFDELLSGGRDEKHGLLRDHRELLSISLATVSHNSLSGALLYLLSIFFELLTPGTGSFQVPSSLPSHLPWSPFGRRLVVDGDRRFFRRGHSNIWIVTTLRYMTLTSYMRV